MKSSKSKWLTGLVAALMLVLSVMAIPVIANANVTSDANTLALRGPVQTCLGFVPGNGAVQGAVKLSGPIDHVFTANVTGQGLTASTAYDIYVEDDDLSGGAVSGCAVNYVATARTNASGQLSKTVKITTLVSGLHTIRIVLQQPPGWLYMYNPSMATTALLVNAG